MTKDRICGSVDMVAADLGGPGRGVFGGGTQRRYVDVGQGESFGVPGTLPTVSRTNVVIPLLGPSYLSIVANGEAQQWANAAADAVTVSSGHANVRKVSRRAPLFFANGTAH